MTKQNAIELLEFDIESDLLQLLIHPSKFWEASSRIKIRSAKCLKALARLVQRGCVIESTPYVMYSVDIYYREKFIATKMVYDI